MALLITMKRCSDAPSDAPPVLPPHLAGTGEDALAWVRANFRGHGPNEPYSTAAEMTIAEGGGEFGPVDAFTGYLKIEAA
jgi:hypothetical protein